LKIFFALSIILIDPFGNTLTTSPLLSHPFSGGPSNASAVFSGFLKMDGSRVVMLLEYSRMGLSKLLIEQKISSSYHRESMLRQRRLKIFLFNHHGSVKSGSTVIPSTITAFYSQ
jgi:hypothetical protein